MRKQLSAHQKYNVFLVDPQDRALGFRLSDTFRRAGNSLGYNTNPNMNSPCGAVRFIPKEDMGYTEMKQVLELVAKTLKTPVAVSTAETLDGDDITFHSLIDDQENSDLREKTQTLAMSQHNLLMHVTP